MRISLGLPNTIPNIQGSTLIQWAILAEKWGYWSLATIDRIAYPSYDSLVVLSVAAGATKKINLLANVILSPARNTAILAKQAASLRQLSNGRFMMGVGVGSREDDFTVTDMQFSNRGRRLDDALEFMHKLWHTNEATKDATPLIPIPLYHSEVPLLIGGYSEKTIARIIKWGIGWTASSIQAEKLQEFAELVRNKWTSSGRQGNPYILSSAYYALGPHAKDKITHYFNNYYSYLNPLIRDNLSALSSITDVRTVIRQYQSIGVDELIFVPTDANLSQAHRLSDVVL